MAFYSALAAATALGLAISLGPINPIKALYWTAVINGLTAMPVMTVMMLMAADSKVMGTFTIKGWLHWLGWASTVAMVGCVGGVAIAWVIKAE